MRAGTGFSTDPGLRVDGRLFAMLRNGQLVVRLPPSVADDLVRRREADHFYGAVSLPLTDWVRVGPNRYDHWLPLANKALHHARIPLGQIAER